MEQLEPAEGNIRMKKELQITRLMLTLVDLLTDAVSDSIGERFDKAKSELTNYCKGAKPCEDYLPKALKFLGGKIRNYSAGVRASLDAAEVMLAAKTRVMEELEQKLKAAKAEENRLKDRAVQAGVLKTENERLIEEQKRAIAQYSLLENEKKTLEQQLNEIRAKPAALPTETKEWYKTQLKVSAQEKEKLNETLMQERRQYSDLHDEKIRLLEAMKNELERRLYQEEAKFRYKELELRKYTSVVRQMPNIKTPKDLEQWIRGVSKEINEFRTIAKQFGAEIITDYEARAKQISHPDMLTGLLNLQSEKLEELNKHGVYIRWLMSAMNVGSTNELNERILYLRQLATKIPSKDFEEFKQVMDRTISQSASYDALSNQAGIKNPAEFQLIVNTLVRIAEQYHPRSPEDFAEIIKSLSLVKKLGDGKCEP